MKKKVVYIAHPISGDIQLNISKVLGIVKSLNMSNYDIVPFAPYLVDVQALNDDIPEERARGFENNVALFKNGAIDEVWLYGDRISPGMKFEINLAEDLGIPIIVKSDNIIYIKSNRITIAIEELASLRLKANDWEALQQKMANLYDKLDREGKVDGLDEIGELAATHLGFM